MSCDPCPTGRPAIRYRPGVPKPDRRKPASRRLCRPQEDDPRVVCDLPGDRSDECAADQLTHPPVGAAEITVIETFLGDRIDALLARCAS